MPIVQVNESVKNLLPGTDIKALQNALAGVTVTFHVNAATPWKQKAGKKCMSYRFAEETFQEAFLFSKRHNNEEEKQRRGQNVMFWLFLVKSSDKEDSKISSQSVEGLKRSQDHNGTHFSF